MGKARRRTLGQGKFLQLIDENGWEYADRVTGSGVVAIVALTPQNELVLTEQYRVPVRRTVIDLPAGLIGDHADADEPALQAAERELMEEAGYESSTLQWAFTGPSSPGMTTEMISFFLTRDAQCTGAGGGDDTEDIRVHVVPLKGIHHWLRTKSGERTCVDQKVYAALGLLAEES